MAIDRIRVWFLDKVLLHNDLIPPAPNAKIVESILCTRWWQHKEVNLPAQRKQYQTRYLQSIIYGAKYTDSVLEEHIRKIKGEMLVNQFKFEPVYCPTAVRSCCNRKNLRNEKMIYIHINISLFTMRIMFHCISKRRGLVRYISIRLAYRSTLRNYLQ